MKIAWLGHHCYRIVSESGLTIITDPYLSPQFNRFLMGDLKYDPLDETADIVLISHDAHTDHNNAAVVRGNPEVIRGSAIRGGSTTAKGIEFKSLACFHDSVGGKMHGENNILFFELDGMRICHSGDLGHELTAAQASEMGRVDVLLLAVGYPGRDPKGFHYRIDTNIADGLYYQLKPKVILPGHYSNPKCTFKLAIVDEFLDGKRGVIRLDEKGISEVDLNRRELPESTQIMVLKSVY
ncbi:MAG: MBL fold metallo-hydrolase [Thermodesulfobacteriota bacterium]